MRVVLTGGPGAGKSSVAQRLVDEELHRFALVPEAATQIYSRRGTRWDWLDANGQRDVQRAIFQMQVEQEERIAMQSPGKILLLDRGTIDGATYWPDGSEAYWRDIGTTLAEQVARYDLVIWLQTCAALGLYDGAQSNACRFEQPADAVASGEKLKQMWRAHPRLHLVDAFRTLDEKVAAVRGLIDAASNQ